MRSIVAAFVLVVWATASVHAGGEQPQPQPPLPGEDDQLYSCTTRTTPVNITLKPEAELKDLVTWVMGFTCKEFALDPRLVSPGRKVMLIAPNKLTTREAYELFLVALSTVNLTVVPKGARVLRITEINTVKKETLPVTKTLPDRTEQVVRYVYRPTYTPLDAMQRLLMTLKSDAGDIQPIGTFLVITDFGSQINDMMRLAGLVDVPNATEGIYLIGVKRTDVTKLVPKLEQLFGPSSPAAGGAPKPAPTPGAPAALGVESSLVPVKILPEERTNRLIVVGSEAAYKRIRDFVVSIDNIEMETDGGMAFHVFPLSHAIAEELAATLNASVQGAQSAAAQRTSTSPGGPPRPPQPTTPPAMGTVGGTDGGAALENVVKIMPDKATNSLIVMSTGRDYLAMREMIRQLDQPRRQVWIEGLVVEFTMQNDLDLGTSSHGAIPRSDGSVIIGGAQTGQISTLALGTDAGLQSLGQATGLISGIIGSRLGGGLFGQTIPSYAVLFQALSSDGATNIRSTPSVIAADNEAAHFLAGITIPYRRGPQVAQLANQVVPTTNIDTQKLALDMTITPHISNNDMVNLEIDFTNEDLANITDLGPSWNTRKVKTRAIVHDQGTVVIGGLLKETESSSTTKVPILGDIPIIGHLFKTTRKTKQKTNLLILLTPHVMKDQRDLQAIVERQTRQQDEFVRSFHGLRAMPFEPHIDYARKRGVVEEINRAVLGIEDDVAARAALQPHAPVVPDGPIQPQP